MSKKQHRPRLHISTLQELYLQSGDIYSKVCSRLVGRANMLSSEKALIDMVLSGSTKTVSELHSISSPNWEDVLQGGGIPAALEPTHGSPVYFRELEAEFNSRVPNVCALDFNNVEIWTCRSNMIGIPVRGVVYSLTGEKIFSFVGFGNNDGFATSYTYYFSKADERAVYLPDTILPDWIKVYYSFKNDCLVLSALDEAQDPGSSLSGRCGKLADFIVVGEKNGAPNLSAFHGTPMKYSRTATKEQFKIAIRKNPDELLKEIAKMFPKEETHD